MIWNRIRSLLRRLRHPGTAEQQLDDEIESYLQHAADHSVTNGMSVAEARRSVAVALGGKEQLKERLRDGRFFSSLDGILADLRYACRMAARRKAFTAIAVLTMALGIGGATATFSIFDTVLLRPLPFKNPNRLVSIFATVPKWRSDPSLGKFWDQFPLDPSQFLDLKKKQTVFDDLAIYNNIFGSFIRGSERHEIRMELVSSDFFSVLGVNPIAGRLFSADDANSGAPVVLSYGLWQREFGGEAGAIGRTAAFERWHDAAREYTIIGVLPPLFDFAAYGMDHFPTPDAWTLADLRTPKQKGGDPSFGGIAHLKSGISIADAAVETGRILNENLPDPAYGPQGARLTPRHTEQTAEVQAPLFILLTSAGLLLLIACGNVANLLLGQAATREQEIAVRSSIGASRWRITRQLIAESLLLSSAGGLAGTGLAVSFTRGLVLAAPMTVPRAAEIGMNVRVLIFVIVTSILTGTFFGIAPVLAMLRANVSSGLQRAGSSRSPRHQRFQTSMIVGEIALSFVLLTAAGLLTQSLYRLTAVTLGFHPEGLWRFTPDLSGTGIEKPAQIQAFVNDVLARLKSLPEVQEATVGDAPFAYRSITGVQIEGQTTPSGETRFLLDNHDVLPNYFVTVGIPIIRGRAFTAAEIDGKDHSMVVNRAMATKFWSLETAIGKRIGYEQNSGSPSNWYSIVGIAEDVREFGLGDATVPTMYFPKTYGRDDIRFIVRGTGNSSRLSSAIREQIQAINKDVGIGKMEQVQDLIWTSLANERYRATLINLFAIAAASLVVIGLYGVVSRFAAYRRKELGIRMALGAAPRSVLWLVLRRSLNWTACGVVVGTIAALVGNRWLSTLLYGIRVTDPMTYLAIGIALLGIAVFASYLPARRAARTDPMVVLRAD